jgi:hypothetical protein
MKVSVLVDASLTVRGVVVPERITKCDSCEYPDECLGCGLRHEKNEAALAQAKADALPFEDQEEAKFKLFEDRPDLWQTGTFDFQFDSSVVWEVVKVEQMNTGSGWVLRDYHDKPAAMNDEYREAYRLTK